MRFLIPYVIVASFVAAPSAQAQTSPQAGRLKIVVVEGEGAVNIIQAGTAVAPVIEVRDRNDQPVAGAVVTFAIRNGRAGFSGARTLTVTTNAVGRATASGFAPTGTGAVQISASAVAQGQTVTATIAQMNVATAAQAAGASGAGGAGAGGAGGAGGGGGIGIGTASVIGGAAVGGTLVAREVIGGEQRYVGSFSVTYATVFTTRLPPFNTCQNNQRSDGTITLVLTEDNGTVTAEGVIEATDFNLSTTCPNGPPPGQSGSPDRDTFTMTGTTANFAYTFHEAQATPNNGTQEDTLTMTASLANDVVTLTLSFTETTSSPTTTSIQTFSQPVTLRRD